MDILSASAKAVTHIFRSFVIVGTTTIQFWWLDFGHIYIQKTTILYAHILAFIKFDKWFHPIKRLPWTFQLHYMHLNLLNEHEYH